MGSTSSNTIGAGSRRVFQREREPRGQAPFPGRDLRRCHGCHPQRDLRVRAQHRGRVLLRSLSCPSGPRGGEAARNWRPGQARRHRRAVQPHDRRVRARRTEDRGGRANPCGPAAAPAPSGQLPTGDDDHPDAVGPPGNLVSPGSGARGDDGRHCAVRNAAQ